ncbi:MAG: phosphate ABC transporter permease PstA [Saprospiraceae bacterium]|nr:phosphate ABC transporter permease PstA [Saprospiraceae bacterium]
MTAKRLTQAIVFSIFAVVSALVVAGISFLLYYIFSNGLSSVSWEFLTRPPEQDGLKGGIMLSIAGTLLLVFFSILFAFPVGVLSGIFMNEYSRENAWKKMVRLMTNNLAGIPSIVFGLFGLALFVKAANFGASILAGSLTLAAMILPILIRTTEESLKQIPGDYRAASLALGATKWYTIRHVVLPAAFPNIISGLILGIGRIAGETAPIIFTVAASYLTQFPHSVFSQVMALPFTIYYMASSHPKLLDARPIAYGAAVVLLAIVLSLNLLSRLAVTKDKAGAVLYFLSFVFPPLGVALWAQNRTRKPVVANDCIFAAGVGGGLYTLLLFIQYLL